MADTVSIAGSVVGIAAFGLQISQTISQYLDAIKCRDEELHLVKQRLHALYGTLKVIGNYQSRAQMPHQEVLAAVSPSLQISKLELEKLNALVTKLSDGGSSSSKASSKAKEGKKKLLYIFDRDKIRQLEAGLNQSLNILQVVLQGLGL